MDTRDLVDFVRLFPPQLCFGSQCPAVAVLQSFLLGHGIGGQIYGSDPKPPLQVTGVYDEATERAVMALQHRLQYTEHQLKEGKGPGEGRFGPLTRAALRRSVLHHFDADAIFFAAIPVPGTWVDEDGATHVWPPSEAVKDESSHRTIGPGREREHDGTGRPDAS